MPLWLLPIWTFLRRLTWKEIAAAVLTVGAALIYIKGKRDGVAHEKTKRLEDNQRASREVQEIENEVEALPDDDRRDELRRFVRQRPR